MKIKTAELADDLAINWAVATALGHAVKVRNWQDITDALDPVEDADTIDFHRKNNTVRVSSRQTEGGGWYPVPSYSTDWAAAGPIIEREYIVLTVDNNVWYAACVAEGYVLDAKEYPGPTPLIAVCRCFVASRLGDEVEIPEELL